MSLQQHPVTVAELAEYAAAFALPGQFGDGGPYGNGHINDTYALSLAGPEGNRRYILQRLNTYVFRQPELLMANVARVTAHVQAKLRAEPGRDPEREGLTLVPARTGAPFLRTPAGEYWRAYLFIEDATGYDIVGSDGQAWQAAYAFGQFQRLLADLPAPPLAETIPDFHHTPKRLACLQRAIAADACGRRADCGSEIELALSLGAAAGTIVDRLADGTLPWRVTHNDTKLNNVLLDNRTGRGVCIIDLDTVMPGSALYDFGDLVRTASGHFAENTLDLASVKLDLGRFAALAEGYLAAAGDFLCPAEIALLPAAGFLMTYEVGIRFLADYLMGDQYFRIHRPRENLERARVQLAFAADMRARQKEMAAALPHNVKVCA